MCWFTDAARADDGDDDDEWDRRLEAYAAHLASIGTSLPPPLLRLATDDTWDLKDGRFVQVAIDRKARAVTMVIACGDLQVGYHELTIRLEDANVVPENFPLLEAAVGAEFKHGRLGRSVTEIRAEEVDVLPDGRFILRLDLWPFYEFGIEFGGLTVTDRPQEARPPARAGRFRFS